jgi:hypothetical protein
MNIFGKIIGFFRNQEGKWYSTEPPSSEQQRLNERTEKYTQIDEEMSRQLDISICQTPAEEPMDVLGLKEMLE